EHTHRRTWPERDRAGGGLLCTGERAEQVSLTGAVRADQTNPFPEVDLFGERQEQVIDRYVGERGDASGRIAAAQTDRDVLIWHRGGWRSGGNELLPSCLGAVGLGGVLEVLRGALL